jgi:threonine dehydrogenase-like Zn-dependent dehydrogenase
MSLDVSQQDSVQFIPGHEVVGVITQVGAQVKHLLEGDRCVADPTVPVGIIHQVHPKFTHISTVPKMLLLPTRTGESMRGGVRSWC